MYNWKADTADDLKEVAVVIGLHNEQARTPLYSMASLKFQAPTRWISPWQSWYVAPLRSKPQTWKVHLAYPRSLWGIKRRATCASAWFSPMQICPAEVEALRDCIDDARARNPVCSRQRTVVLSNLGEMEESIMCNLNIRNVTCG